MSLKKINKKYKMKTIKNYVSYTLLTICGFAIWYLGTSFVLLEINFTKWEQGIRLLVILEGIVTSIGAIALYRNNR